MVQAEDRAHRIGQLNSVNIYYLFGESTIDTLIYPRLKLKSEVFSSILDGATVGDFRIENERDKNRQLHKKEQQLKQMESSLSKKYENMSKQIQSNESKLQSERQLNINDFFFQQRKKEDFELIGANDFDVDNQSI